MDEPSVSQMGVPKDGQNSTNRVSRMNNDPNMRKVWDRYSPFPPSRDKLGSRDSIKTKNIWRAEWEGVGGRV